jgi:hypothetical protein
MRTQSAIRIPITAQSHMLNYTGKRIFLDIFFTKKVQYPGRGEGQLHFRYAFKYLIMTVMREQRLYLDRVTVSPAILYEFLKKQIHVILQEMIVYIWLSV